MINSTIDCFWGNFLKHCEKISQKDAKRMEKLCKKCERDKEEEVNLISQNSKALQKHMVKIVLDCFVLLILNCADKKFKLKTKL